MKMSYVDLSNPLRTSQAKGQFKKRSTANNVEIIIPVPADADTPKFRVRKKERSGLKQEALREQ